MVRTEEAHNLAQPGVARVVAACFALSAFAIATLAGLFGGNDALTVLMRALLAVMVCYPVGLCAGMMADMVLREQLALEMHELEVRSDGNESDETSTRSAVSRDGQRAAVEG